MDEDTITLTEQEKYKFLQYCIQQCGIEKAKQFELESTSEYKQGDTLLGEYAEQKHKLARAYLFVAKELL